MNLKNIEPALSLEDVISNFKHWRETRVKRGKVPDELMEQAFSLVGHYQSTKISSALGFCYSDFRKKCLERGLLKETGKPTFIEVSAPPTIQQTDIRFSVSRPDGTVMQIHVTDSRIAANLMGQFLS